MRRLFLGVIALTFAALIGSTADGQIRLVPGPQKLVSFAPRFITAAFFNADGFEDAAVTNSASNQITVLFGKDGNSFGSAVSISIGRTLRGVQAGDINCDGKPDLAVADFIDGKVFTATGNGDGTFNAPIFYKAGAYAFDVAIGNFDGQKCNDLMVVDQGIDKVSVFLNKGGNQGFDSNSRTDYPVGDRPKRGASADLNGDTLDDLVVINTGTNAADSVSILLNNGVGGFLPATNFTVGAGAVDLAIADFNDDGVPDIAVLNQNIVGAQTTHTVSILINQTELVNGKRVGTGFFDSGSPVALNCPASIAGIPISCRPNGIAAGDFDGDGFMDFAVTFFTQPLNNVSSIATSGLVQAFQGHGTGTFDFATQVSVGIDPEGIVTGDFNGDGFSDMTIAEQGSRSVRIITSLPPPLLPDGHDCHLGRQCVSNFCTDGVCCSTASCPTACPSNSSCPPALPVQEFCNIPDLGGICSLPVPDGNRCTLANQCASGFCVDGFCCEVRACPADQFCNTGSCKPPAGNGTPCNSSDPLTGGDNQCASGHCTDGVCCTDDRCPAGQACNIPTLEGTCNSTLVIGAPCTVDGQCTPPTPGVDLTGYCTDGVCCSVRACPSGESCNIDPREGFCSNLPTPSPTATPTATPQPNGSSCTSATDCNSTFCVDGTCCSTDSCPADQFCNILGFRGHCHTKSGTGVICGDDQDCQSSNCQIGSPSTCQGTRTPTPTPTLSPGDSCGPTAQCPPGFTCSTDEGVCCSTTTCPAGYSCRLPSRPGFCGLIPTPVPTNTPPAPLGHSCSSDDQCGSGFCTDGVCCEVASCGDGLLCNACAGTGKGSCNFPGTVGDPCEKNTDCDALLLCLSGGGSCTGCSCQCGIPAPTPTFPAPTPTDGPGPQTTTFRSGGGCSINNGIDGSAFWLLAALPLIFGMRRARLQRARISRTRDGR